MSLLSSILKKLGKGADEAIQLPLGFSSKKMAKRLGGDEEIGQKFYTGRTKKKIDPTPSAAFESDIIVRPSHNPGTYYKPLNNKMSEEGIAAFDDIPPIDVKSKRNALIAAGAGVAGLGLGGGYLAGSSGGDNEEEVIKNYLMRKYNQQFGM